MQIKKFENLVILVLVAGGLVAGFAREITLAFLFGTSRDIEIFRVAYGLPGILGDSLAVSFVSVLIPFIIAAEKSNNPFKNGAIIWACLILATSVTFLGIVTMPLQARLLAPGIIGEDRTTLIFAGQICWLIFFLTICSLPLRAIMSVKGKLWPAASAQLVKASSLALSLITIVIFFGVKNAFSPVYAAIIASSVLLAVHIAAIGTSTRANILRTLKQIPDLAISKPIISALIIVILTQVMMSGGRLLDRAFASDMNVGTLASLEYSYALLMAMASLIAASTNIIIAPKIGRSFQENGFIPGKYFRMIFFISLLAAIIGIIVSPLATFIVKIVFQYGAFGEDSLRLTARIFQIHSLALGPIVLVVILNQMFLLQKKQSYLVVICFVKISLRALIIIILLRSFNDTRALTYGLLISESIIAIMQIFVLLYIQKGRRVLS